MRRCSRRVGSAEAPLYRPCDCIGETGVLHSECARQLVSSRGSTCTHCNAEYRFERAPAGLWGTSQPVSGLLARLACLCSMLVLGFGAMLAIVLKVSC